MIVTLSITFTPQVTSNHRVCWKKTTDASYDCTTIVAGVAGTPVTANIPVTVIDSPCEPATFEGYVQPTCETEGSLLNRTTFPNVIYTCGLCDCPVDYTYNPATGFCEQVTYFAATPSATTFVYTLQAGGQTAIYGQDGASLYEDITSLIPLAGYQSGTYKVFTGSPGFATPITVQQVSDSANDVFDSQSLSSEGRLNRVGLWGWNGGNKWGDAGTTFKEWLPLTYCLNIPITQTYIFAIAADNQTRARLSSDGGATFNELVTLYSNTIPADPTSTATVQGTFRTWHMFPITLAAGNYILELSGWNWPGSSATFGAEIYNLPVGSASDVWPTQQTMIGFMKSTTVTVADFEPYILFTTRDLRAGNIVVVDPLGSPQPTFTCPSGGTLSTCYGGVSCVTVDQQPCVPL